GDSVGGPAPGSAVASPVALAPASPGAATIGGGPAAGGGELARVAAATDCRCERAAIPMATATAPAAKTASTIVRRPERALGRARAAGAGPPPLLSVDSLFGAGQTSRRARGVRASASAPAEAN